MIEWSDGARNALEGFLVEERGRLARDPEARGADPEEVIADLRAHVQEELVARGTERVEPEDLEEVLASLRPRTSSGEREPVPPGPGGDGRSGARAASGVPWPGRSGCLSTFLLIFGCLLPGFTVLIELSSSMCADEFFDPLPTPFHVTLALLVPVMGLVLSIQLSSGEFSPGRLLMVLAGMALGTTIYYSVVFAPLVPLAVPAVILMGLGLLPLAPLLSLSVLGLGIAHLRRQGAPKGALAGVGLTFALLFASGLPTFITQLGARWASSEDPERSARGLGLLRSVGSETQLLRACYLGPRQGRDPLATLLHVGAPVSANRAREIYYRVTGRPFNSLPPPGEELRGLWRVAPELGWAADPERGGDEVAGQVRGLVLESSRLDAKLETEAALAYLEWTLVFANSTRQDLEARAQVLLPPGGFATRLTLWVDGEEREAAFDGRGKVREAYRDVAVVRRLDPALVTETGPDRVLLQCFPVPANGELAVRLGITAPLALCPGEQGALGLPAFGERNFAVGARAVHAVWLQGDGAVERLPEGLIEQSRDAELCVARGELGDLELSDPDGVVRVDLGAAIGGGPVWTRESLLGEEAAVLQTIELKLRQAVDRLAICVDGSAGMARAAEALSFALAGLPDSVEFSLWIGGDVAVKLTGPAAATPENLRAAAEALRGVEFRGGGDAVPALVAAFDEVHAPTDVEGGGARGAVLWVHGAQPVLLAAPDGLAQRLELARDGTRVHGLRATPGANRVVMEVGAERGFERVARTGPLADDLAQLLGDLCSGAPRLRSARQRVLELEVPPDARPASKHLARLWAGEESRRILARGGQGAGERAIELAAGYQVITAATGAVVLETEAQYERHGLEPVDAGLVPSVPEPEMVALLAVAGALLLLGLLRSRGAA